MRNLFWLIFLPNLLIAQVPSDTVYFIDIVESALRKEHFYFGVIENIKELDLDLHIIFDKKIIVDKYGYMRFGKDSLTYSSLRNDLEARIGTNALEYSDGKLVLPGLSFWNCEFLREDVSNDPSLPILAFDSVQLRMIDINFCSGASFDFSNTHIEEFRFVDGSTEWIRFFNCKFSNEWGPNPFIVRANLESFVVRNSKFFSNNPNRIQTTLFDSAHFHNPIPNTNFTFNSNTSNELHLIDNEFYSDSSSQMIELVDNQFANLNIKRNMISGDLNLNNSKVSEKLIVLNNRIDGHISLNEFLYSEVYNEIYWNQLDGEKIFLSVVHDDNSHSPYYGKNNYELRDEVNFKRYLKVYQNLYNIYKLNGDLESANGAYAEMKDVEGRRYKYIFEQEGGFQNYFRWKLNRLLKVYTDHGTNPALAIVISTYVIIFFAIFYFFFPSEWDVTSKSKLIRDFRTFTQKNKEGYLRPFVSVTVGFFVSLINALTLSMNSFTTLGFGRIPTKGLAKYVCIIQGFIGWFLLSIFTVALINQVLA